MGVTMDPSFGTSSSQDADAAFEVASEAANEYAAALARKVRDLRVLEDARALLQAEKVADTNFDDLFLDRQQLRSMPAPDPLITGVLPRNVYAVLRGRDQSFKSFVALDWAACLATGKRWQDHPVVDPIRVLYIAGEGADGLSRRLDAWETAWGHTIQPHMFVTRRQALDLYQPAAPFDHLLAFIEAGGFGLVVVDTLRRVSGRAEGNGSEMGAVVDNIDRIKQATDNGSVLVISHTGKEDGDTRGYSGIEDDADVVWHAKRSEMRLALDLTKFKDGPDGRTMHLEAITADRSLVLQAADGSSVQVSNEHQLAILDALRTTFRDGATPADLIADTGIPKASIYRACNALSDAGHIVNTGTKRSKYFELPALTEPASDTPEEAPDDQ